MSKLVNSMLNTLDYYNQNAAAYASGTLSANMTDTRQRFLALLPQRAKLLDFGCGSGRDTKAFLQQGYDVDAVDGSAELCRIASETAGIPVRNLLFSELDAVNVYDGIWACSSILHLPKGELKDVFGKIRTALKDKGILYTSFKYGTFEGERDGRYFTSFTPEDFRQFIAAVPGLCVIDSWVTADVRPGREDEKWLNLLLRKA